MEFLQQLVYLNLLRKKRIMKTSTLNILNYIIKNRKIKLVYMSTISVFKQQIKKLKENDKTLPISTYSKNKILVKSYVSIIIKNSILT